jgi:hypothetical protein
VTAISPFDDSVSAAPLVGVLNLLRRRNQTRRGGAPRPARRRTRKKATKHTAVAGSLAGWLGDSRAGQTPALARQEKFSNLLELPWRSIQCCEDGDSLVECQCDDFGGEEQRLLKLPSELPLEDRDKPVHNAIVERDTCKNHLAAFLRA